MPSRGNAHKSRSGMAQKHGKQETKRINTVQRVKSFRMFYHLKIAHFITVPAYANVLDKERHGFFLTTWNGNGKENKERFVNTLSASEDLSEFLFRFSFASRFIFLVNLKFGTEHTKQTSGKCSWSNRMSGNFIVFKCVYLYTNLFAVTVEIETSNCRTTEQRSDLAKNIKIKAARGKANEKRGKIENRRRHRHSI